MRQGWIRLYRQLRDHPFWTKRRKFSKAEAWIDLLLEANHKDAIVLIGNRSTRIRRGQALVSQRELSRRWRWNHKTVKRFLNVLKVSQMVAIETVRKVDHGYTLITITNYSKFQDADEQEGSAKGSTKGSAKSPLMGHKQEGNNSEEVSKGVRELSRDSYLGSNSDDPFVLSEKIVELKKQIEPLGNGDSARAGELLAELEDLEARQERSDKDYSNFVGWMSRKQSERR